MNQFDYPKYFARTRVVVVGRREFLYVNSTFEYTQQTTMVESPSFVYANCNALHPMWF